MHILESQRASRWQKVWFPACAAAFYSLAILAYFHRALGRGDLIAVNDSTTEYFPQFSYPYHSWTRLLFSGYPLFADPQNMSFLPGRLLLAPLGAWNAFVLSGYVIAACCACAYAHELTRDRFAALAAGLIYGLTGHLLCNLSMVPMVQSMACAPLTFWALERGVRAPSAAVALAGGLALACCCFGGYGQITAYTAVAAVAYAALGVFRARQRWLFVGHAAGVFAFGAGASAAQWLPTLELLLQSQRTHMPYGQFVGWGWTFVQSTELLLSRAFLGPWSAASHSEACGLYRNGDHIYVGLLPLMASAAGAWSQRRSALTWFWCAIGAFSVAVAFGDHTPVARWLYEVPPYNLFRVLTRHSMFLALGVSALSAIAIAWARATPAHVTSRRIFGGAMGAAVAGFVVAALAASRHGCAELSSRGVLLSAAALALSISVLAVWLGAPRSPRRSAALIACLALDLLTYDGWGGDVPRYGGRQLAAPSAFEPPAGAATIAAELDATHERMWGVKGEASAHAELPVNRNLLWSVPSAAGYSPIAPTHALDVLDMGYGGAALGAFWEPRSVALDVAAVRLITIAEGAEQSSVGAEALHWARTDLGLRLGGARARDAVASTTLWFSPSELTGVGLVLDMERSARLEQGQPVAMLTIGGTERLPLLAGVDVSEWALECPSERDAVRHRRASVYDSRPVPLRGATCPYYRFVSVARLARPVAASSLTLDWLGALPEAVLRVHKVTLLSAEHPAGVPLDRAISELSQDARWLRREPSPGRVTFENRRVLPRARFVDTTLGLPLDAALATLRSGRTPTGEPFDPRTTALIPEGAHVESHSGCSAATPTWLTDRDGSTSLQVDLAAPCFLVLADTFYDGWSATIDDLPVAIQRTNFAFRGVEVPAGRHRVTFEFASATLHAGLAVSATSLAAAALLLTRSRWRRRRAGTADEVAAEGAGALTRHRRRAREPGSE
jgi:hypothetical protein